MTQHRHCRPIVRRRGFSACVGVFLKINPTIAEGLAILHRHRVQRCFDLAEAMVGALFDEDWLALATLTRELADLIEALDAPCGPSS
ncbi:MAG: hypothetical protein ACLPWF_27100 [Bryobacteraceae bacterium]|jgi:hypothetical protein